MRRVACNVASMTCLAAVLGACSAPAREGTAHGRALANFAVSPPIPEAPRDLPAVAADAPRPCPPEMAEIPVGPARRSFCVDRWEASLALVLPSGEERLHSPFAPADGERVRAVSRPGVLPQGYVSAVQAAEACAAAGKRLCRAAEWQAACRGPERRVFGYGDRREAGRCNDTGRNPVIALFGRGRWTWETMNRPELNQLPRTLSPAGDHPGCTNGYGVFDMVGNLHEWVADPGGTFYGGYYQDVSSVGHGSGCGYQTSAHEARYHDYSTGFRCCADVSDARR